MFYRYAIYAAATPGDALHERAARWLGRDAAGTAVYDTSPIDRLDDVSWRHLTADARFYGFHATLKPPFRCHDWVTEGNLDHALADFARRSQAISVPLAVDQISEFLALRPQADGGPVAALAADAVRHFDEFRASPEPAELVRRRAAGLTPAQEENLQRWGYPYVMDDFRLHFTLTTRMMTPERDWVHRGLRTWFADVLTEPFALEMVWLFVQPAPNAPFRQHRAYSLRPRALPHPKPPVSSQQYHSPITD
jgi:hypothetical protein